MSQEFDDGYAQGLALAYSKCKPKLEVTINVEGLVSFLLGWKPLTDDEATVIGDSRVAYLSAKDPGSVFMPAAWWHDKAYVKGSEEQKIGMTRANVDRIFLHRMLTLAEGNYKLECEAVTLFLVVRKFGARMFEGLEP